MTLPKLSSAFELILSTPLIPDSTSSIGSMTSRSTTSGDAPGIEDRDRHDRRLHVRELVGVELQQRSDAEHHERQHGDDGDDGPLDGEV